ncbi:MAG: hypothetical protein FJX57_19695 [Alphaproteobacteria bacterium]|nr:hypothetical protein [Alphaproteobacteria bacterium]
MALGFQLVDELAELVEIDAGPEPERVRDRLRRLHHARSRHRPETRPNGAVDRLLKRDAESSRTFFQEAGQVIVNGQCRSHERSIDAGQSDVKASGTGRPAEPRANAQRGVETGNETRGVVAIERRPKSSPIIDARRSGTLPCS